MHFSPTYLFSVCVQLGEQGRLFTGGTKPSPEGAGECGVYDSGARWAQFHHSSATSDHAQPLGDRAAHMWFTLHQPGVPQGGVIILKLPASSVSALESTCFHFLT